MAERSKRSGRCVSVSSPAVTPTGIRVTRRAVRRFWARDDALKQVLGVGTPGLLPILVAGRRTTTVGRVSMDMLACDLTDIPDAGVDSPVVLWGEGMPADEVATAAGTISYEMFCALARRVPIIESNGN